MSDLSGLRAAFGAWVERCLKRILLFATVIAATSAAALAVNAQWDNYRPWATRAETSLIADKVYPSAIKDHSLYMTRIQRRIDFLEDLGTKMKPEQVQELWDMRGDMIDAKEKETNLLKERALFKMNQEHR
jgi:hypothetical protein